MHVLDVHEESHDDAAHSAHRAPAKTDDCRGRGTSNDAPAFAFCLKEQEVENFALIRLDLKPALCMRGFALSFGCFVGQGRRRAKRTRKSTGIT